MCNTAMDYNRQGKEKKIHMYYMYCIYYNNVCYYILLYKNTYICIKISKYYCAFP